MNILGGRVFRCRKVDTQCPPYEKRSWPNIDSIAWLETRCAPIPLGISPSRLPDRNWLITLAYSFDQSLEIFTGANPIGQLDSIPIRILERGKFFNPYDVPHMKSVLKRSNEQKAREELDILVKRRA